MYNQEQLNAIYGSNIGIEFEFYSNYKVEKTRDDLSKLLKYSGFLLEHNNIIT